MTASGSPTAPAQMRDALGRRLDALGAAVDAARGRVDEDVAAAVDGLLERAAQRLTLSGEHTIVALAGATGSGKSSLFNALTDMELAGVGVRRPTTSWALACAWGPDGAAELLTWMGIAPRHQVSRMGMLERAEDTSLEGLILLDLPDHDSTEVSHHVEMDRLVTYSDLLIWVLDPQKYADAAIHERYIRPMATYGAVTLVVLNQIDRIPAESRDATIADVKRLIEADGLPDVQVLAVSATRGDGLEDLRRELAARIRAKSTAKARLAADVADAAADLAQAGGVEPTPKVGPAAVRRLEENLADQLGLHHVVDTTRTSVRRRTVRRTRWPLVAPFARSKAGLTAPELPSVSGPAVEVAVRDFVDDTAGQLSSRWRLGLHRAVATDDVAQALTAALDAEPAVRTDRIPRWSRGPQALQWLLLPAFVAGLAGLAALGLERWADVETRVPEFPQYLGVPLAGWVAGGAVVAGVVVDLLSRVFARAAAARRAAALDDAARDVIARVVDVSVVRPVASELQTYSRYRDNVLVALG
ncbi:MAG TPA: GTPase [Aeromicrobium sp.]|nr:GTPase [Aeromicrobium sp.]